MFPKCLQCVAAHKHFVAQQKLGNIPEEFPEPPIADAITLVANWQQQQIMGQMIMACVAIPACEDHIEVQEQTAEEKAIAGGRLLQGRINPS